MSGFLAGGLPLVRLAGMRLAGLGGGVGLGGLLQRVSGFLGGGLRIGLQRLGLNRGGFLGAPSGLLLLLLGSLTGICLSLIGARVGVTLIGGGVVMSGRVVCLRRFGVCLIGVGLLGLLQAAESRLGLCQRLLRRFLMLGGMCRVGMLLGIRRLVLLAVGLLQRIVRFLGAMCHIGVGVLSGLLAQFSRLLAGLMRLIGELLLFRRGLLHWLGVVSGLGDGGAFLFGGLRQCSLFGGELLRLLGGFLCFLAILRLGLRLVGLGGIVRRTGQFGGGVMQFLGRLIQIVFCLIWFGGVFGRLRIVFGLLGIVMRCLGLLLSFLIIWMQGIRLLLDGLRRRGDMLLGGIVGIWRLRLLRLLGQFVRGLIGLILLLVGLLIVLLIALLCGLLVGSHLRIVRIGLLLKLVGVLLKLSRVLLHLRGGIIQVIAVQFRNNVVLLIRRGRLRVNRVERGLVLLHEMLNFIVQFFLLLGKLV